MAPGHGMQPPPGACYNAGMITEFRRLLPVCVAVATLWPMTASADAASDLESAVSALRSREFSRAAELFTQVLVAEDVEPGMALRAWRGRGHARHELRQFRLAIADYSRAIDLRPGLAELWNSRCWGRLYIDQPRAAIEDCDVALKLDPKFGAAYDSRAMAYSAAGEYDKALEDHKRALERDPLAEHYYNRGITHERRGDKAAADKDFAEARKRATDTSHWERIEREMAPLRKRASAMRTPEEPARRAPATQEPDTRRR
jgi:tetratricopeptide (TPR) repeat protein